MLPLQDEGAELSTKQNSKVAKIPGIGKDPSTHTAFLPDKEREQQEQHLREQLKQEYELRQQVCIVQHTNIHLNWCYSLQAVVSQSAHMLFVKLICIMHTCMQVLSSCLLLEWPSAPAHVLRRAWRAVGLSCLSSHAVGCPLTCVLAGRQVVKNEPLQITYSYWDGTGHRRQVVVRKGDTISQFLKAVKLQLSEEFREVRWGNPAVLLMLHVALSMVAADAACRLIVNLQQFAIC